MKKKLIGMITLIIAVAVLFTGCSGGLGSEKLNVDSGEVQFSKPVSGDTIAKIHTSEGTIEVLLFEKYAPKAVQNFVQLAQSGYYNEITFHRTVENFVVQSGSPDGTANGGNSWWGLEFEDEFSDRLHHYNGALAMANHGADTNGSQFYFVTAPLGEMSEDALQQMRDTGWREEVVSAYSQAGGLPQLDYRYTVFGQIYDGLNVAYKISRRETDENERPKKDIIIESVEIIVVE